MSGLKRVFEGTEADYRIRTVCTECNRALRTSVEWSECQRFHAMQAAYQAGIDPELYRAPEERAR